MPLKQLALMLLILVSSAVLFSQTAEEYVVLSVYKTVYKQVDKSMPVLLKSNDIFKDFSELIFQDEDAQVFYFAAFSKGTFGMGHDKVPMPVNAEGGDRLETIEDVLTGERNKLPRKFFKEERKMIEQEMETKKN